MIMIMKILFENKILFIQIILSHVFAFCERVHFRPESLDNNGGGGEMIHGT